MAAIILLETGTEAYSVDITKHSAQYLFIIDFINDWKVAGALVSPKGITRNS